MRSRVAQRLALARLTGAVARVQGTQEQVVPMGGARHADLVAASRDLRDVAEETLTLQDANGAFYFLPGYSILGGPDLLA